MIYAFGTYQLDTVTYELYDDGNLCKVETRAFEILIYLIEHRHHIVSREELAENLWPGQIISQAVVNNAIKAARRAIGDSGTGQHKIRTVRGRGFRFVAEAHEQRLVTAMLTEPQPHDSQASSSLKHISIDPDTDSQNVLVGDYGFVTVLCGTLEHPEALSSSLGYEATQGLRRAFFTSAREEAEQHDATFKFFGADGFLILFGLPGAHDDHVRRAVLSGLRIQDRLYESCEALEGQPPINATIQMGLYTGLIEIQSQRDHLEWTPLHKSEPTVRAIRLHDEANGGILLASKGAIPYVQEVVKYTEHGILPMSGQEQPIIAYRICGLLTS